MRLLNHEYRELGIVLSNEWIFQCPKCKAFAIGITKPFINLKRFCQNHRQGKCPIRSGHVFYSL